MDDDLMFDYLVQMGQMRPEEAELKKKQAMVETLRKGSLQAPEGQMIGKHYVAPSFTQSMAQIAQGYAANQGQQGVDEQMRSMNAKQAAALEELRKRKKQPAAMGAITDVDMNGIPAAFQQPMDT